MHIPFLAVIQTLKWGDKNKVFWKCEVNFWGPIFTLSFWKWFSLKIIELEEQLLQTSLSMLLIFEVLYLVKFCPFILLRSFVSFVVTLSSSGKTFFSRKAKPGVGVCGLILVRLLADFKIRVTVRTEITM